MMSQSESVRFWYEVVADCLREHPSWPDDRSGMDALDAMMRAAFYEGWEHDCPHVEPVRCPRCEGVEMAQLPHTIGCPLAEAPQAEPASDLEVRSVGIPIPPPIPDRVVLGANGAYWRDFGDGFFSMCPNSTDNDPVIEHAVFVREAASTAEPEGDDRDEYDRRKNSQQSAAEPDTETP